MLTEVSLENPHQPFHACFHITLIHPRFFWYFKRIILLIFTNANTVVFFQYFANYKLGKEYTDTPLPYATYFLNYVIFAAQVPNLVFNWINVFLNVG